MTPTQKTILHADDAPGWREYVRAAVSDAYRVESVGDFDATLARLTQGGVDLLLLDNLMPGTAPYDDAASVCAAVRQKYPGLAVIVLTSSLEGSPTPREEMERMVGTPVLCKEDVESEEGTLQKLIDRCLSERPPKA